MEHVLNIDCSFLASSCKFCLTSRLLIQLQSMPSRPLRGVVLLLAAVLLTVDWSFAVPKATRTKLTSQVGVELGQQDKVPDEASARSTDAVSLALAAAGCAVAMRAASAASEESEAPAEEKSFMDKYGVAIYIGLWYLFNIGYNIYNKKALISYPFPWACAMWQMTFGWLIFCPLWILRTPKLTVSQAVTLAPAALGHLATHVGAVVAFFAGAVSFGHIVKAREPVVSSFLNFAFLGEVMPWQVYASLLPIIGGVGIASASELSFNWLLGLTGPIRRVCAVSGWRWKGGRRGAVYSKKVMKGDIGENMDSSNTFSVLTIMATFMLIPISLAIEGPTAMVKGFKVALSAGGSHFMWQCPGLLGRLHVANARLGGIPLALGCDQPRVRFGSGRRREAGSGRRRRDSPRP
eukprot:g23735.t2